MKGVILDPNGDKRLITGNMASPEPGAGQVLLDMKAACVNYRDFFIRENPVSPYGGDMRGQVVLSDGVGIVRALGEGVTSLVVGDRVCPAFFPNWLDGEPTPDRVATALGARSAGGVASERLIVSADAVVKAPSHLCNAEAASIVCAGLTAWTSLFEYGRVDHSHTILVQGTGGVSLFVLQFAHALGARVILLSSSDEKLERARTLGAVDTINYRKNPDWVKAVLDLTDGRGVDQIVDIGGKDTLPKSFEAIGMGGSVSIVGVLTGFEGAIPYEPVKRKLLHVHSIFVGSKTHFERMNSFISEHNIRPVIDRVYPLDQADAAVTALSAGAHFGKLAIDLTH